MSKKHCKALAAAIYLAQSRYSMGYERLAIRDVVDAVCTQLKADNQDFDRTKFLEACGIT